MPDQTATCTPASTSETDPKSNLSKSLESRTIRVLLVIACLLMAVIVWNLFTDGVKAKNERVWGEIKDRNQARVEAIEDRYGIHVNDYTFLSPGEWTIDGKQYICNLDEPTGDPADSTLSCVAADALVDFADIKVEAVAP